LKLDNRSILIAVIIVAVLILVIAAVANNNSHKNTINDNVVQVTTMPTTTPLPSTVATPLATTTPTQVPTILPSATAAPASGIGVVGGTYSGVPTANPTATPYPASMVGTNGESTGIVDVYFVGDYNTTYMPNVMISGPSGTLYNGPVEVSLGSGFQPAVTTIGGAYGLYTATISGAYDNVLYDGSMSNISYSGGSSVGLSASRAALNVGIITTVKPVS
jgi:hypothetical protein